MRLLRFHTSIYGTQIAVIDTTMAVNPPGKSTREMANRRYLFRLVIVLVVLCLLIPIWFNGFKKQTLIDFISWLLAMYGLVMLVDRRLDKLIFREQQAVRGAEAEETVGAILNRLPEDYEVLHDVPKEFGNIDHLVFRKDGAIFVIETKSHRGCVTVLNGELRRDGQSFEKNFVSQTLDSTSWVKAFVARRFGFEPSWIQAAIVFTNAHVPSHCKLLNVAVIRPSYLERWMEKQPGNPQVAQKLWPQIEKAKLELTAEKGNLVGTARTYSKSLVALGY